MAEFVNSILSACPAVIAAILLLIVAFIAASIVKKLVITILEKVGAQKVLDKTGIEDTETGSSIEFVGKLAFFIVFLLFLPAVLDRLGMQSVSAPISGMVSSFLNFLPNLVAAVLILVVGLFVAKMVRNLLIPLLNRTPLNDWQKKAGVGEGSASITTVLAYIVYVIIIIPVAVAALNALGIAAISEPAVAMLDSIFSFIPNIAVAVAIGVVGVFIAKLTAQLVGSVLSGVGTDTFVQKLLDSKTKVSFSKVVANVVRAVITIIFLVEAVNVLHLSVLQGVGTAIIGYMPFVLSAAIIVGAAYLLSGWAEAAIVKKFPKAKLTAAIVKVAIIALGIFMTLSQLGIASKIVDTAFIIVLGALAVAFAIAFGVGGRDFAANALKKVEKLENDNAPKK